MCDDYKLQKNYFSQRVTMEEPSSDYVCFERRQSHLSSEKYKKKLIICEAL